MFTKAVVTGACGFLGRPLVAYLRAKGLDVVAIDLFGHDNIDCRVKIADITKKGALNDFLDEKTILFHMAGKADVASSVTNPRQDFEVNVLGLLEVLESVRRSKCQLIFPSTASIYDKCNPLPLGEKAFIKPTSPYSASKATGEMYCYAYHRSFGVDVKIARLFSVYGPGMDRFAIHDIVLNILKQNNELIIFGDGSQIRDYLHINDVMDGLWLIANKGEPGEDYNLASGNGTKLIDLARQISEIMGHPKINIIPSGNFIKGELCQFYANISKVRSIGFEPKVSLDSGLQRTVDWLVSQQIAMFK